MRNQQIIDYQFQRLQKYDIFRLPLVGRLVDDFLKFPKNTYRLETDQQAENEIY